MGNIPSIVFSGIAPHPPIMVPEVGHESIAEVRDSIAAMAELTLRLIASGAETLVLISPHAPLDPTAFVAYDGPQLYGDFANFRAPEAIVETPLDDELLSAITLEAQTQKYEVRRLSSPELDHGTAVPLYFLQRNGWHGRVVALGYSFLSNQDHVRFGACVRNAADKVGRPVAFIASGDLSHRLKPEAPAGYNPNAHLFDEEVVAALSTNSPERIINIDQDLRKLAGECGYRSMLVALGATQGLPLSCEVLNYEAPFGVGYLVAQVTNQVRVLRGAAKDRPSQTQANAFAKEGAALPALARQAVEAFVQADVQIECSDNLSELLAARAACFVSIKTKEGDLRGCIGTIEPTRGTLAEELIANAISAATCDPRFKPVKPNELPQLQYSVDVLSTPEPTTLEELDPDIYGVIVEDASGDRRGLLLPKLEGIDTAGKQVGIAARKAGIREGTPVKLSRFRVQRFSEGNF
jgi:AmmeMemoRadiSam system protein A/AmmeMemoRadiSam system protein B